MRRLIDEAAGLAWALAFTAGALAGLALLQLGYDPERVLCGRPR